MDEGRVGGGGGWVGETRVSMAKFEREKWKTLTRKLTKSDCIERFSAHTKNEEWKITNKRK